MRLVLLLLLATSASAQPAAVRPFSSISIGVAADSLGRMLGVQASAGVRRGIASARLRGTIAADPEILGDQRDRWDVAALGGITLGERAQMFLGAGPGLTGGEIRKSCFLSTFCPDDETLPVTLGLALALDGTVRTSRLAQLGIETRLGIQAWIHINPIRTMGGIGLLLQVGR